MGCWLQYGGGFLKGGGIRIDESVREHIVRGDGTWEAKSKGFVADAELDPFFGADGQSEGWWELSLERRVRLALLTHEWPQRRVWF